MIFWLSVLTKPAQRGRQILGLPSALSGPICSLAGEGCWICDAKGGGSHPELNLCHWDPKISSGGAIIKNPGLELSPMNPGGAKPPTQQTTPN